ncbi:MAG: RrF2 family transcriptional regulator [Roseburia sp.]
MISPKGRYALRVMIDLAEHKRDGYISLKDIAARQEISKKYLEIIVKELVQGKMVTGQGGHGGGYVLCREPEEYAVGEILEWMEGSLATVSCLAEDTPPCTRAGHCKTLPLWKEHDQLVHDFFYSKHLIDLL